MDVESTMTVNEPKVKFAFGQNWKRFLPMVDDERITLARQSLTTMLKTSLAGKTFIDIGCGSGLFSLSAKLEGATVTSFDVDNDSVQCCEELKSRFFKTDSEWHIFKGSALDKKMLQGLGTFDVVYSWGVLHHTGHMWDTFENVVGLVKNDGRLYIAIYNDQGAASRRWFTVKRLYNNSNSLGRFFILSLATFRLWGPTILKDLFKGNPFRTLNNYKARGMSAWRDVVDWVGGYPFEVAKPEEVFNFFYQRGFELITLETCAGGLGCNSFVFQRKK